MKQNVGLVLREPQGDIALQITMTSEESHVSAEKGCDVLSAIVSQARQDEMIAITLKVDQETRVISMHYFGPAGVPSPQWWKMSPPPFFIYPAILQCVIILGQLQGSLPITGLIPARMKKHRIQIHFEFPTLNELKLWWDE